MYEHLEPDDRARDKDGLVLSLKDLDEGRLLLVLDDVRHSSSSPHLWKQWCFFTHFAFDKESLEKNEFSDEELKKVGFAVLCRLKAQRDTLKE
jgi:hypothetical protein